MKNLAVMLTDIKGFTERTSRQTREENARMLEEHDRMLVPLVRAHRGKLVQKRGDALLCVFETPTEAVLCGEAIQDRLWRHNRALAKEQQIHVRVVVHVGEVLLQRDSVVGEPVQVVAAVEGVAEADEVVFTEAVHLAMNRAEIPAEEHGSVEAPGRSESLKLYRCVPKAKDGPPFGGRDAQRSAPPAAGALQLWSDLGRRKWIGVGAALLLVAVIIGLSSGPSKDESLAREQLASKHPTDALLTIERAERDHGKKPRLEWLKAAALHQLDRHDDEAAVLNATAPEGADALVIAGLAEDFADGEPVRKLLDASPRAVVREVARGPESSAQWGALRYLDASKDAQNELVDGYQRALASKDCDRRSVAARRLGELDARSALDDLKKLAASPRERVFIVVKDCGQDAAAEAVRKLEKK